MTAGAPVKSSLVALSAAAQVLNVSETAVRHLLARGTLTGCTCCGVVNGESIPHALGYLAQEAKERHEKVAAIRSRRAAGYISRREAMRLLGCSHGALSDFQRRGLGTLPMGKKYILIERAGVEAILAWRERHMEKGPSKYYWSTDYRSAAMTEVKGGAR